MESVEHMTRALQVAAQAMRTARENNRSPEVMDLLEQARQQILRIAKKEADADIESNGVKALAHVVEHDYASALKVIRSTQLEWRQRGIIARNALAVLEAAKPQVTGPDQVDPQMAEWTYGYVAGDLRAKIGIAEELTQDYVALEAAAIQGLRVIGAAI